QIGRRLRRGLAQRGAAHRRRAVAAWPEQRKMQRHGDMIAALKQTMLAVDALKQLAVMADVLRGTEEEVTAWAQCEVKHRNDARLKLGAEIDQQIAAGDEIDARERRIAHDAVRREDAEIADLLDDDVAGIVFGEE